MQQSPSEGKQKRHVATTCDTSKLVVGKSERQDNKTKVTSSHCTPCGELAYPLKECYGEFLFVIGQLKEC